ncbi:hypothetical protein CRUP_027373 [Coryphaenoides rupestris]|nr:hypothetical protein CRUP_027373 [Coryphaenoides rupestris]
MLVLCYWRYATASKGVLPLLEYGSLEFPQINYAEHNGRAYRYFYACGFGQAFSDSLLKMDVHTKELKDKSTFLLFLDAKTFTELGRAEVPVNIPYGTHGVFNDMSQAGATVG